MTLRVGLVGFGFAARVLHVPLIVASGMQICGVVSRNPPSVLAALPSTRVVPNLDALLTVPELDLIVIATPNDLHEQQAVAALEAGKAVLVDKPAALSTAAVDRVIAAAGRGHGLLCVFHNRRWDSDFLTVRRLIQQGVLGPLHNYEAHWDRYRPSLADRWRERTEHGGGVLLDLGTHLLDQVLTLFGTPDWLEADIRCQRPGATVDDAFDIRMGKGALRIVLSASSLSAEPRPRFRLDGEFGSFCKSGLDVQEQQLRAGLTPLDGAFGQEPPSQFGQLTLGESGARTMVCSERGAWLQLYAGLLTCRARGAPPPVPALEAREGLRIIEAARLSSATGRRVAL